MKKIILFLFVTISIYSCAKENKEVQKSIENDTPILLRSLGIGDKIGEENLGVYTITANTNDLIDNWNDFLDTYSSTGIVLSNIRIDVQSGGEIVLIGESANGEDNAAVELLNDGGDLYERGTGTGNGITCTCSGCTSTGQGSSQECIPKVDLIGCYCTSCSKGTCTKTVTEGSSAVLTSA